MGHNSSVISLLLIRLDVNIAGFFGYAQDVYILVDKNWMTFQCTFWILSSTFFSKNLFPSFDVRIEQMY